MGIESLAKVFDPGALAHAVSDAVLPKEMEWMSGVLGAAVDIQCGDPIGALKEGLDVFHDLKDVTVSSSQKQPPSFNPPGGWSYEPSPPPSLRATPPAGPSTTVTTTMATATVITTGAPQGQGLVAKAEANAAAYFQLPAPAAPPSTVPAPTPWRGTPPASQQPAGFNLAQMVMQQLGPQRATQDPKTMTPEQFMKQTDLAFMNAVRDGNIPPEISKDPAAMASLQARMAHISEMNQLMTSMIQAMHQMQMAVIQNVRV